MGNGLNQKITHILFRDKNEKRPVDGQDDE